MQVSPGTKMPGSNAATPTDPTHCRCGGTGAYTVEIALKDAVVSDRRLCLDHGLSRRARVYDTTTGRVGLVMDVIITSRGTRAYLRPPQGGREWTSGVDSLRPPTEQS